MKNLKWWQKAVFYQIYPRSFADGNGDCLGDFKGMIEKLDYLKDLGIDAIWLSPHYPSPYVDCGYDIADYMAVAPEYGTMDDFKQFLDGAHQRGMRLILDLVMNHTSDKHAWFLESRSSRDNPKRDWYIWRDPKPDGSPPNNWQSTFDGPAWEYDAATDQYYYHYFFREQPDLNWRNPEVREAMFNMVRFWLDMGVDGFRLDAIGTIFEHPDLPDQPLDMTYLDLRKLVREADTLEKKQIASETWNRIFMYQLEQPGMHELMKELRAVVDEYGPGERVLIAENENIEYHGNGNDELHMVFNFPLMQTECITPQHVLDNQLMRLTQLAAVSSQAWPANTLSNHDTPRLYSRYGDGIHNDELIRLHLALLLTLKGTPFLYYGDEIGMRNLELTEITQLCDTMATWVYRTEVEQLGADLAEALKHAIDFTRDRGRSPMQWENAPNAGFCPPDERPWLPINPDYAQGINVADQLADSQSLLNFYRNFLRLRRQNAALVEGEYEAIEAGDPDVLAFLRYTEEQTCLVVLNFSDRAVKLNFNRTGELVGYSKAQIMHPDRQVLPSLIFELPEWGILIAELQ
mgnify:FL=1